MPQKNSTYQMHHAKFPFLTLVTNVTLVQKLDIYQIVLKRPIHERTQHSFWDVNQAIVKSLQHVTLSGH
jgi:hypothetical protein